MKPLTPLLTTTYLIQASKPVLGWGQGHMYNQFKGGSFTSTAFLMASDQHEEEPSEELRGFRERLERSFAIFDGDDNLPLNAFIWKDGDNDMGVSSSVADGDDETLAIRALDRVYDMDPSTLSEDDYADYCEGDLCDPDECQIPESFKLAPGKAPMDVMAFLGIKRAEPIQAQQPRQQDKKEWQ